MQGGGGGGATVVGGKVLEKGSDEGGGEGGAPLDSGLRLALPSGEVVRPRFPPGCLLIMNGEGSSLWMRAARGAPRPYAPPHEVVLPSAMAAGGSVAASAAADPLPSAMAPASAADTASASLTRGPEAAAVGAVGAEAGGAGYAAPSGHRIGFDDREVVRAWFGRMFFPPRDAALQQQQQGGSGRGDSGAAPLTFGEYRQQTYSSFHDGQPQSASTAGMGAGLAGRGGGWGRGQCGGRSVAGGGQQRDRGRQGRRSRGGGGRHGGATNALIPLMHAILVLEAPFN